MFAVAEIDAGDLQAASVDVELMKVCDVVKACFSCCMQFIEHKESIKISH